MLLALRGSVIEERADHLVVRTPDNPTFHWGNFLLLREPPAPGGVASWLGAFRREFPHAGHLTLGVDGTAGDAGPAGELRAAGLVVDRSAVMTADAVHPPPRPNRKAVFRMLDGDDDWAAALALKEANNTEQDPAGYRVFARRQLAAVRRLQQRGLGGWFGAFADGRMVSGLGVFTDGSGLARFQSVDTRPGYRNQGLAGTLVHIAGAYALTRPGVQTLVMVADPGYHAIRVYRSVGFTERESQVQLFAGQSLGTVS